MEITMSYLAAPYDRRPRWLGQSFLLLLGLMGAAAVLTLALLLFPRLVAVYELYNAQRGVEEFLYQKVGLGEAWSALIAAGFSFFYALAWVPLLWWTFRVIAWRYSTAQLITAFACWMIVYAPAPIALALRDLLTPGVCFDQKSGHPLKYYTQAADGKITLFDQSGFDPNTGANKLLVTSEICNAYALQNAAGAASDTAKPHPEPLKAQGARLFSNVAADVTWEDRGWFSYSAYGLNVKLQQLNVKPNCWVFCVLPTRSGIAYLDVVLCNNGPTGIKDERKFYVWFVPHSAKTTVRWEYAIDQMPTHACHEFSSTASVEDLSSVSEVVGTFYLSPNNLEAFASLDVAEQSQ
jgi:hypothetical protein